MDPDADQLALAVEPQVFVSVVERRGSGSRELTVGPLPESEARGLVALLLLRSEPPEAEGPWRLPLPGGTRSVTLRRDAPRDGGPAWRGR